MTAMRVGIAVFRSEVRAVAVRGSRVVWTHVAKAADQPLEQVLAQLYRSIPQRRFGVPGVRVVFGPQLGQQRCLAGLPVSLKAQLLRTAINENIERFFLRTPSRLAVTPPVRCPDGTLIAAALDAGAVSAVLSAATGVTPEYVGCAAAVLGWALQVPNGMQAFDWGGDDERVRVRLRDGVVVSVQRVPAEVRRVLSPNSVDAIDTVHLCPHLVDYGKEFAEAYGAAVATWRNIPALRRRDLRPQTRSTAKFLRVASCAFLAASLGAWLTAPAFVATRAASRTDARMRVHRTEQARFARATVDARRATAAVLRVDAFRAERRSMVALLGQLTDVLPDSTAVTSMRVDSLGGTISLASPRAMEAVRAMVGLDPLDGVQVAGPLLRDNTSGSELERVTLRFRFRRSELSRPTSPPRVQMPGLAYVPGAP